MELSLDPGNASYRIASYTHGQIILIVNSANETHNLPLVIMPEKLLSPFSPKTLDELKTEDFQALLIYKPQVVLLGTGEKMRPLKPELFASLAKQNIGIEVMTTPAACRTYTILMSEGRNVAAILFP